MGHWERRAATEHVCDYPRAKPNGVSITEGDIWKCDCGKMWVVLGLDFDVHPLDPPRIKWRRKGI